MTNEVQVMNYIEEHGSITQLDAYKFTNPETGEPAPCTRLSAVIYRLIHTKQYPISKIMEENPRTGKQHARYYLAQ